MPNYATQAPTQSGTVGTGPCSSGRTQSKISPNVRNELEKRRRLWRFDVIIMQGCQGHEDECCWLPSVARQCQAFTERHCRRAETNKLKETVKIWILFNRCIYLCNCPRLLVLPSRFANISRFTALKETCLIVKVCFNKIKFKNLPQWTGTGVVRSVSYYCSQIVQRAPLLSLVRPSSLRIALTCASESETIAFNVLCDSWSRETE